MEQRNNRSAVRSQFSDACIRGEDALVNNFAATWYLRHFAAAAGMPGPGREPVYSTYPSGSSSQEAAVLPNSCFSWFTLGRGPERSQCLLLCGQPLLWHDKCNATTHSTN